MDDKDTQYFDLVILLGFGDMDLMKAMKKNPGLRVGEYFSLLSDVGNNLQTGIETLSRVLDYKTVENDLEKLETIRNLFEDIGYLKPVPAIDNIIKARKDGRIDVAADYAKETLGDLKNFQMQITASRKEKKPGTISGIVDGGDMPREEYELLFLNDAVVFLDRAETTRKLRILAVDDSPVMLNTISSVLGEEYKVHVMPKPTMVEKFLEQITPDLFLLDYEMPEINGFELIPIIRKFGEHKETPIIFLTSLGTLELVSSAAKLGACDFIVKPLQADNLREKVAKHISRKMLIY